MGGLVYLSAWSTPLAWGVRTWRCFQLREIPLVLMNHSELILTNHDAWRPRLTTPPS